MEQSRKGDERSLLSSVAAVRRAWLEAVRAGDFERLAAMVTDDVVVVHGDGRCVRGKDELKMDFLNGFKRFTIGQTVSSAKILHRGRWAFDIADVESTLIPIGGGDPSIVHSTTVVVLARQSDGQWRVARVIGMLN
jgi:uncharacterized protein (TIGR02246 family)